MKPRTLRLLIAAALATTTPLPAAATDLPAGFAYLAEVDASVAQDIRYAGAHNFTRARVPGYQAAECILARPAAEALARIQAELKPAGLALLVYDCYRPARAVRAFVSWAAKKGQADAEFYPGVARHRLIAAGYIAARSGHSSGGTVDLTLLRGSGATAVPLDMGTAFDFFDPLSHTLSPKISAEQSANRKRLVDIMARHGFSNYSREWWHFRYKAEPFRGKSFDFEITPRP